MRTITAIGGNLFEVAARELGSPMQWINIARANSISDSIIRGKVRLVIPPFSLVFANGIGPQ